METEVAFRVAVPRFDIHRRHSQSTFIYRTVNALNRYYDCCICKQVWSTRKCKSVAEFHSEGKVYSLDCYGQRTGKSCVVARWANKRRLSIRWHIFKHIVYIIGQWIGEWDCRHLGAHGAPLVRVARSHRRRFRREFLTRWSLFGLCRYGRKTHHLVYSSIIYTELVELMWILQLECLVF